MEVIVCQSCDAIIEYIEADKTGVLYGKCSGCREDSSRDER